MDAQTQLSDHLFQSLVTFIERYAFPPDTYALQVYIDGQADPRYQPVVLYFNTEQQVKKNASVGQEARWNFAYWLQESVGQLFTPGDTTSRRLKESWLREKGLWYSDAEEKANYKAVMPKWEQIDAAFWRLVGATTRRLHENNVILRRFGRALPVLVMELELSDQAKEATRLANPEDLIADFLHSG